MTPEDIIESMSALLPCVAGLPTAVCQTGEPYVVLSSLGIIKEGEKFPFFPTQNSALIGLLSSISAYAAEKAAASGYSDLSKMTLYWRCPPEDDQVVLYRKNLPFMVKDGFEEYEPHPMWRTYARLVVTDKPIIYPSLDTYESSRLVA